MIIEAREDTITLRGDIKANIWAAIQAAAALLLNNHPTGIIIDASAVTRVTPKGAETFADAFRYINAHNARIVVAGLSAELIEIGKQVPGVRAMLPLASTVEEARASLRLEEVTPQRGRARIAGTAPILGKWHRAVYFADKLAIGESAEIHLVDLIRVPRTLPIGSPLPERESEGQARLVEAKALVEKTGLKCFTHAEHVRTESAGLVDFANQLDADYAVVSIDKGDRSAPHIEEPEAMSLLEAATFEVSLVKGAPSMENQPAMNAVVPAVGAWSHAIEHACKLVSSENAQLTVVYPVVIPRTERIDISKPDIDAIASDIARESVRIGKHHGVKVKALVERMRDPVLGFLKMFEPNGYDLAVVGVKRETTGDYHTAHAIAQALMQELPCEVIFLRVADDLEY